MTNGDKILEPVNMNKDVIQGCGLSPNLFIIYINKAIKEWKHST